MTCKTAAADIRSIEDLLTKVQCGSGLPTSDTPTDKPIYFDLLTSCSYTFSEGEWKTKQSESNFANQCFTDEGFPNPLPATPNNPPTTQTDPFTLMQTYPDGFIIWQLESGAWKMCTAHGPTGPVLAPSK